MRTFASTTRTRTAGTGLLVPVWWTRWLSNSAHHRNVLHLIAQQCRHLPPAPHRAVARLALLHYVDKLVPCSCQRAFPARQASFGRRHGSPATAAPSRCGCDRSNQATGRQLASCGRRRDGLVPGRGRRSLSQLGRSTAQGAASCQPPKGDELKAGAEAVASLRGGGVGGERAQRRCGRLSPARAGSSK